jgi:hypothetical protein
MLLSPSPLPPLLFASSFLFSASRGGGRREAREEGRWRGKGERREEGGGEGRERGARREDVSTATLGCPSLPPPTFR